MVSAMFDLADLYGTHPFAGRVLELAEIEEALAVAENDNHSAWDLQSDGTYVRRYSKKGEDARPSQQAFVNLVR